MFMLKARLPDFSRPEIRVAALLCLYNFLAMCAFCVIKPVRSALLLDRMGLVGLLISYMGAAVVTGMVIAATDWVSRRVPDRFAVLVSTLILLSNLFVFRFLFDVAGDWVALAFYIWANLFANILFTQFWLLAGTQFTPREGKQLFGWVSAGGTVGGIAGSGVVFFGIESLGTETINLIYFSAFFLAACLPNIFFFERKGAAAQLSSDGKPSATTMPGFSLFREFRHLKLIALVSGASMIVQTVVDYQFNAVVDASIASAEDKAAFFAQFFAGVNIIGLFFQLVLTRMILMRFGIGVALFLLPCALLAGSVGILFFPILAVAVAARMGEAGTRYSIQEATREILYLPLPAAVRSKARPLIDILGSRFFEGVGGLLVLVCTVVLGFSVSALSLLSISLIVLWGITVFSVRHAYVDTLRDLFSEMPLQPSERVAEMLDEETVKLLIEGLSSRDEVQVSQNLVLLDLMHDKSPILSPLKDLLVHPAPAVRAQVLDLLARAGEGEFVSEASALLNDQNGDVRIVAVRYLRQYGDAEALDNLRTLADDGDLRVRVVAIGAMAQSGTMSQAQVLEALADLWTDTGKEAEAGRAEAAQILCEMNDPACDVVLMRLLSDTSPVVIRAALEDVCAYGSSVFCSFNRPLSCR
jgi:AAA family ATP:ADP antiporter